MRGGPCRTLREVTYNLPSNKILDQKKAYVEELHDKISNSTGGVVTDYIGITVEDDTQLRKELRDAGVDYFVVKNTMLRLALDGTPYEELESVLSGSTALALAGEEDPLAAARILCKYAKKSKGEYGIKIGYLEDKIIDPDELQQLSELPDRDGLLSMLLSALTGNLRGLAVGLQAVADKKQEQEGEPA